MDSRFIHGDPCPTGKTQQKAVTTSFRDWYTSLQNAATQSSFDIQSIMTHSMRINSQEFHWVKSLRRSQPAWHSWASPKLQPLGSALKPQSPPVDGITASTWRGTEYLAFGQSRCPVVLDELHSRHGNSNPPLACIYGVNLPQLGGLGSSSRTGLGTVVIAD